LKGEEVMRFYSFYRSAKFCLVLLVITFSLLLNSGCGWDPFGVHDPAEKAVAVLDKAIETLESESANWRMVLEDTRDKLIQEGQSTIANEVSNVLSRTVSDIGIEARCYTDFLRDRVKEDLVRIRASITGEELSLTPVFQHRM
jgi:hypothetical protein